MVAALFEAVAIPPSGHVQNDMFFRIANRQPRRVTRQ